MTARIILGIDPGYDRIGWAVGQIVKGQLYFVGFGCVVTERSHNLFERYKYIDQELQHIIAQFSPQEAAVESIFFAKNQKTAIHVSEARGVILSTLFRNGLSFSEYTPLQIKQAVTGHGKADKAAVSKMVEFQLKVVNQSLADSLKKQLDDTLDAIAITLTHAAQPLAMTQFKQ